MNDKILWTPAEVRALRDRVYGKPISDREWETCGPNWMRPDGIAFLKAHDFPISESLKRHEAKKQP